MRFLIAILMLIPAAAKAGPAAYSLNDVVCEYFASNRLVNLPGSTLTDQIQICEGTGVLASQVSPVSGRQFYTLELSDRNSVLQICFVYVTPRAPYAELTDFSGNCQPAPTHPFPRGGVSN